MGEDGRLSAENLRDLLVDGHTWESWDCAMTRPAPTSDGHDDTYAEDLERARQRSGSDESVITGATAERVPNASGRGDAWESVLATRATDRPGLEEFLAAGEWAALSGTGPLRFSLCDFAGRIALVVGHERRWQAAGELLGARSPE
ncbi:hypothetical protein GDN83_12120 [Gordonia jinghuaiqii]|uniref:Uncharacterized protein n=1 Tax=Gordonia jinghuaiqii TaxID=2758710 RepID=A0A7D7LYA9_9ACTN|nr:hypothetical protein [Gordonia jinghuaiqii]MCR5978462.1 hypothetical protein [Gordonia jinghuaiqii]QMT02799.1 hypothetical protein H1R19_06605 [Gordonia jinghuaiqii]